jgi:hypothetical protein
MLNYRLSQKFIYFCFKGDDGDNYMEKLLVDVFKSKVNLFGNSDLKMVHGKHFF